MQRITGRRDGADVKGQKQGRTAWLALAVAGGLGLAATPALAAGTQSGAPSEVIFMIQIVLLLLVGRLLGEAMQRIGQPAIMGQLIGGILLGPSLFGALWPDAQHMIFPAEGPQKSMLDAVSQLGILMLLLMTGMETDLALVKKVRRAAASVSFTGVAVPFLCGFALGEFLPESMLPRPELRLITSLFLGTALSISSVKIVALVVREMNFMRRNIGQVIVASAIIDDTIGWIIIAITFSLALHGSLDATQIATSVFGTLLFLAVSLTLGRRVVFWLIRWANDTFLSEMPVITTILVVMLLMALTTHAIGVHSVLGAFVAGILIGESPILTRHIEEQLRGLIVALFMPVFFGLAGLHADLTILRDPSLLMLTIGLILIASVGKFAGAFIGGAMGGLDRRESLALACGMNARGSTEVIVATIGLSIGALSQDLFTMIVAMAIITTMAMPPMLRWALGRLPLGEEERLRLDREAFEEKGFVPNLERLLLAVDDSPNGKFASRLAGLLAGSRGMPTTVLHLRPEDQAEASAPPPPGPAVESAATAALKAAAQSIKSSSEPDEDEAPVAAVDVTTVIRSDPPETAIASEARKGYDLLVIGVEPTSDPELGGFDPKVTRIATGFEGPLGVVASRGIHRERPTESPLSILVPVTGTHVSRRAAEMAIALARALEAPLTAIYVSSSKASETEQHQAGRAGRSLSVRLTEEAILKDIVELAERYRTPIRTAVRVDMAADDAILRQAQSGGHDLIVMGVTRRPGERLFFGNVAAAVLDKSESSLLFVAS